MQSHSSSSTATLIARSLVLASHDKELSRLVPEGSAGALDKIFGRSWFFRSLKFRPIRWLALKLENFILPGIITHYLARKDFIEDAVGRSIKKGCRRVVVLGAGYDTLTWRLHRKHPEVSFVELDHPATQARKKRRLKGGENLRYLPLDLGQCLPSTCFSKDDENTVFVVEGLTMYLPGDRVRELLSDLANLAGGDGEVIWTFMEKDEDGSIGFRGESSWVSRWLSWRSEPFLWGLWRDELEEFAKSCGMSVNRLADHKLLREEHLKKRGLRDRSLAEGELICSCGVRAKLSAWTDH